MNTFSKKNIWLFAFIFINIALFFVYYSYIQSSGGIANVDRHSWLGQLGKNLGTLGFLALALVYGRTILKLIVREDSFWKRLEPFHMDYSQVKTLLGKILFYLNKTHAYLGVVSISLIFAHCYFTPGYLDNILLFLILILMAMQGISGLLLEVRYPLPEIKRESYLFHSQIVVGALIFFLAILGHLLVRR